MYRQSILRLSLTVQRGMIPKKHTKKNSKNMTFAEKKKITLFRVKERTGENWKDVADVVYTVPKKVKPELQLTIQAIIDSIDVDSNIMWERVGNNYKESGKWSWLSQISGSCFVKPI